MIILGSSFQSYAKAETDRVLSQVETYLPELSMFAKKPPVIGFQTKIYSKSHELLWLHPTQTDEINSWPKIYKEYGKVTDFEFCERIGSDLRCVYSLKNRQNKLVAINVYKYVAGKVESYENPISNTLNLRDFKDFIKDPQQYIGFELAPQLKESKDPDKNKLGLVKNSDARLELVLSKNMFDFIQSKLPNFKILPIYSFFPSFENSNPKASPVRVLKDFNGDGVEDLVLMGIDSGLFKVIAIISAGKDFQLQNMFEQGISEVSWYNPGPKNRLSSGLYRELQICKEPCQIVDKNSKFNAPGAVVNLTPGEESSFNGIAFYFEKDNRFKLIKFSQQ